MDTDFNIRYARNLQLPGFSEDTQMKLRDSDILIVGAGALGSVAAMYVAASGIGSVSLADFDTVDISNLQRQIFYGENNLGEQKTGILAEKIRGLNSGVQVNVINRFLTPSTIEHYCRNKNVIVECSDNPATKEMVVNIGRKLNIPVVLGGVKEYSGQVMVFTEGSPDYSDIFPSPGCSSVLPCGSSGVFGPLPGIVGCMQASEVIKIAGGLPGVLFNTLLTFDITEMVFRKFKF